MSKQKDNLQYKNKKGKKNTTVFCKWQEGTSTSEKYLHVSQLTFKQEMSTSAVTYSLKRKKK